VETFKISLIKKSDRNQVSKILKEHWSSTRMVSRGILLQIDQHPGFLAEKEGKIIGLINYKIGAGECEITHLLSLEERQGIGSALIQRVENIARDKECKKVVISTTNNNEHALEFYKKHGYFVADVNENIMDEYRKIKPEIPETDENNVMIRDEYILEKIL
jgi:ribosomal protein S18 acetylase RimI-like enzyme